MKISQLKKLSLAYAMALCCQPLLGMENQHQFPEFNSTNINMPQLYNQNHQPQIQQQPQFPGNLQHNNINWMNAVPQNQVIPLSSEYVNTPNELYVINKVLHHTVYPVQQPPHTIPQQGHYIHQNPFVQPGLQNKEAKKLTRIEMNVHKMLLLKEYMNTMYVPTDVSSIITENLHEVTHINPVLDGKLIYTPDNGEKTAFNINNLLKTNGCIDLSNEIFGDLSEYFLITTDLEEFFSINQNGKKLVMLIAPRFLIEEKIGSSAKPFEPIMDNWQEEQASIGIFWRMQSWDDSGWYKYLISNNLVQISSMDFADLLNCANVNSSSDAPSLDFIIHTALSTAHRRYNARLLKCSCSFVMGIYYCRKADG